MHTGIASSGNRNAHNMNISMWTAQWAMHKPSHPGVSITPTINYLNTKYVTHWLKLKAYIIAVSSSSSDGFSLVFAIHIEYILYL